MRSEAIEVNRRYPCWNDRDRPPRLDISPPALDIADFDVDFLYDGPFCARAEEPAPSFEFEHGTSNVQYRMGSWTSNLKFQIAKIEQA
jgi:hypothetical protein